MLNEEMVVKLVFNCSHERTWSRGWIAGKSVVLIKYDTGQRKIVAVSTTWKPQTNNQRLGNACWQICHVHIRITEFWMCILVTWLSRKYLFVKTQGTSTLCLSYELFIKGRNKDLYAVIYIYIKSLCHSA